MKIRIFTKSILLCLLVLGVAFRTYGTSFSEGRGSHKIRGYENLNNFYVDPDVINFPSFSNANGSVFQLISHGRPGQLWLDGRWRNAVEISWFIQSNRLLPSGSIHMNIYGCSFGKGRAGKNAIDYLQKALSVSISASDNITGEGGDWVLEIGDKAETLSFPQFSGNLQYAPIDDMDGDGVPNFVDIDDDNDGVLDAIESPQCYYQVTDAVFPVNVTSMLQLNAGNIIGYSFDRNTSTKSSFQNSGASIAGITLYEITPVVPMAVSYLLFSMNSWSMTQNATSTVMLQGFNGTSWDTLSSIAAHNSLPPNNASDTFKNTLHLTNIYQKFRIQGVAGTNDFSGVVEISIRPYNYSASGSPKPNCVADNDNDGINNNFDLDSDGDGCPDAFESGTYNKPGITATSGDLKNGTNGTVSSTVSSPNAIVSGPYGGNGFANGLRLPADSNAYGFTYTYRQYALFATRVVCASTDGDGINDMTDTLA
jgi:hypothetical protein